jgi:hypothetical protein
MTEVQTSTQLAGATRLCQLPGRTLLGGHRGERSGLLHPDTLSFWRDVYCLAQGLRVGDATSLIWHLAGYYSKVTAILKADRITP